LSSTISITMKKKQHRLKKELRLLSLFSGCGGMDIGFEGGFLVKSGLISEKDYSDIVEAPAKDGYVRLINNPIRTVFANDVSEPAKVAWENYFKTESHKSIYHLESIVELVKLNQKGKFNFPNNIDIVTGGFPCQDFSIAGKRNGFDSNKDHFGVVKSVDTPSVESRGSLYMWMKSVVEITKPKMFIAENVKGLVNLGNVKEIIQSDFASTADNGYLVLEPVVLHAANFGVPQNRERVFFIGVNKAYLKETVANILSLEQIPDDYNPYPTPTHIRLNDIKKTAGSAVTLRDVLDGLTEPEDSEDPSHRNYSKAKYMGKHCQGQTEVNLNGIGPTIRAEHHGNIEFRRLSLENGGKYTAELRNGLKERRLTPRECALIQTFPPDFDVVIPGVSRKYKLSASIGYKVIGNAVPPLLAFHIAKKICSVWHNLFKTNIHGTSKKQQSNSRRFSEFATEHS
jgi:DNA (cytosine-5)-methyltransferase 1